MRPSSIVRFAAVLLLILGSAIAAGADDSAAVVGPHSSVLLPLATDRMFRIGGFRHLDSFFPYRIIHHGQQVSPLPRAERPLDPTYEWNGKPHRLSEFVERTSTTGLLVIKDGTIVFEHYYLGANEKSRFTSMSVAKSFTSTLVGLAIADGKIAGVDAPVTDYLPELKGSGYDGVPIKSILQMSSGVNFSEDYKGTDDLSKMWHRCMEENQQSLDDYARLLTRAEPPGKRFYYRSIDTQVLAWLVNRAAGEHPAQYLSRKIWQPAGMEQDATWLVDGSGMEAGFCCLQATLRDYGRFGLIFLNRGKWNGKQIVPAEWVRQATTPGAPQVQPGKLMRGSTQGYQYQWWTFPGGENHPFAAEGVFFQYVYVRPADNMVIVKTTAFDDFWNDEVEKETYAVFDAIASAAK